MWEIDISTVNIERESSQRIGQKRNTKYFRVIIIWLDNIADKKERASFIGKCKGDLTR